LDACRFTREELTARRRRKPITLKAIRRTFWLDLRNCVQAGIRRAFKEHRLGPRARFLAWPIVFRAVRAIMRYGPDEKLIRAYVRQLEEACEWCAGTGE